MEKRDGNVKRKFIVQAIIDKIENENKESKIRTNVVEGYRNPERIVRKDSGQEGYVPDVISESEGRTDLYAVELDEKDYALEKWKLFALYTNKSNGNFNIVTPKSKLDVIKDMLRLNQISARIIYFT